MLPAQILRNRKDTSTSSVKSPRLLTTDQKDAAKPTLNRMAISPVGFCLGCFLKYFKCIFVHAMADICDLGFLDLEQVMEKKNKELS